MTPVDNSASILVNGLGFAPLICREAIAARVQELAREIDGDYAGKRPVLVCVLNGAFMFFADLVRFLSPECELDFLSLSSYGDELESSRRARLLKDLSRDVRGRHVIIVEDIVDTGVSIDFLKKLIAEKQPASLSVVTLLHKPERTEVEHNLPYVGFVIPPGFVIGYGLDYAQQARNLPDIYIQEEKAPAQASGERHT